MYIRVSSLALSLDRTRAQSKALLTFILEVVPCSFHSGKDGSKNGSGNCELHGEKCYGALFMEIK